MPFIVTRRGASVRLRIAARLFVGVLAIAQWGCYSTGARTGKPRTAAAPESAEARVFEHEKAIALSTAPAAKARAYIEAARACLELNDVKKALQYFHEARRTYYEGETAGAINRGIGEAYFAMGDFALARRYLLKGIESPRGGERERTLAMLVVCCRALDDLDGAVEYRGRLTQPLTAEVVLILGRTPAVARAPTPDPGEGEKPGAPERRAPPPAPRRSFDEPADNLVFLTRDRWSARVPRENIEPMGAVTCVTIHHSGGECFWSDSRSAAAQEIRKIQRYHQEQQGWADIGYHFVIDRTGAVWQGRRLRYQGAHAGGAANNGNIGIALLGNFLEQKLPAAQKQSLEILVSRLCNHFSLPADRVYTHREIKGGTTDCPGPALARCVRELRSTLRQKLVAYKP
jgi:tetratricopeptide (TPR) repeat protein